MLRLSALARDSYLTSDSWLTKTGTPGGLRCVANTEVINSNFVSVAMIGVTRQFFTSVVNKGFNCKARAFVKKLHRTDSLTGNLVNHNTSPPHVSHKCSF